MANKNYVLEVFWDNEPIPVAEKIAKRNLVFEVPLGVVLDWNQNMGSVSSVNSTFPDAVGNIELTPAIVGADPAGSSNNVLNVLEEKKLDKIDYVQHFRGLFSSYNSLVSALPTALTGDYAHIDSGTDFDRLLAIWDSDDSKWVIVGVNSAATTDEVAEGSSNLYFTQVRVLNTLLSGLDTTNSDDLESTDTIVEAFGKLQAQQKQGSGSSVEWVNASTLAGYYLNPRVSPASIIQFAKIDGMLWIRGSITTNNSVGNNLVLVEFSDPNYILDYNYWLSGNPTFDYDRTVNKTVVRDLGERKILFKQVFSSSGGVHKFRIVTEGDYSSFAESFSIITPTCIGKTKN